MIYDSPVKGERIYLRSLTEVDAGKNYLAWLNDPEVNRFMETRHHRQEHEDVVAFIREKKESEGETLFGIFLNENDRHIGNIKIGPVRPEHKIADVSLFLGEKSEWGRGYGSEAIGLVLKYAFETLDLNKVVAWMYSENQASLSAFLRAGFVQEAQLKDHYIFDGRLMDMLLCGMTAADYAAGQSK